MMRAAAASTRTRRSRAERSIGRMAIWTAIPLLLCATTATAQPRVRARELGLAPGVLPPGPLNSITDVAGVLVGHVTVKEGDSVRTGITAILPHAGNLFRERVPAALHVGNGFGKLLGATQLRELGELETPILLTCTLCVWKAADAMVEWMLSQPQMGGVRSINPVVAETNDGGLNAIRSRPITPEQVRRALTSAAGGAVEEGSVGAGTGTQAFGWKGGIGTSSRVLSAVQGGFTVGVLVQTNFGGVLQMMGAPVGRELGRFSFRTDTTRDIGDGSIIMVVATDAPLDHLRLERLARRALAGLARTGSTFSNGSGDYVIAFSTYRTPTALVVNDAMSPLFQGAIEATEEAIYNSLLRAETVRGFRGVVRALPIDSTVTILKRYGAIRP